MKLLLQPVQFHQCLSPGNPGGGLIGNWFYKGKSKPLAAFGWIGCKLEGINDPRLIDDGPFYETFPMSDPASKKKIMSQKWIARFCFAEPTCSGLTA
jgi:hypothetical protein